MVWGGPRLRWPHGKEARVTVSPLHGRRTRSRPARERDAVRGHQDRLVVARPRPRARRDRRDRHRRHRLPRLLRLLPRGGAARAARRLAALRAPAGRAALGRGRGPDRLGRAHQDAGLHPRQRARRPAHEVRAPARGAALPVDGRGARAGPRRRGDRRDRAAHPGAARVRRRRGQLPRPHRLAGGGRDRERPALRRRQAQGGGADHAHRAESGPRGGHAARGALRDREPRGAGAAARRPLPGLAPRPRGPGAGPGGQRPAGGARGRARRVPLGADARADAQRAARCRAAGGGGGRTAAGGAARRR